MAFISVAEPTSHRIVHFFHVYYYLLTIGGVLVGREK